MESLIVLLKVGPTKYLRKQQLIAQVLCQHVLPIDFFLKMQQPVEKFYIERGIRNVDIATGRRQISLYKGLLSGVSINLCAKNSFN